MTRATAGLVALVAFAFGTGLQAAAPGPVLAQAPTIAGEAYGHYTSVSLFGGPASTVGPAPTVQLPAGGSGQPVTGAEPNGAMAQFGPANLFSGLWPKDVQKAPPSGPITVSTKGTADGASVTSSVDIGVYPKPVAVACSGDSSGKTNCTVPGGFGPMPVTQGEQLHSSCTATPGGVTGSATFVKAQVATSTDSNGEPTGIVNVPDKPPVNYSQTGTITNIGDTWKAVFNEQITGDDGSLTVNAVHLFLFGPSAKGEQILGHVKCLLRGAPGSSTTSASPSTIPPPTVQAPPTSAPPPASTPASSSKGASALPYIVLAAVSVVLVVAILVLVVRRARAGPASS